MGSVRLARMQRHGFDATTSIIVDVAGYSGLNLEMTVKKGGHLICETGFAIGITLGRIGLRPVNGLRRPAFSVDSL